MSSFQDLCEVSERFLGNPDESPSEKSDQQQYRFKSQCSAHSATAWCEEPSLTICVKLVGDSYAIQMNIRLTLSINMGLDSLQRVMHESPQAWGKRVVALYACQAGSARIQRLLHVCYSVRARAIDIVTRMAFFSFD